MTNLTFTKIHMPGADLGIPNCLPDIKNDSYIRSPIAVSDRVSQEEKALIGKGMIPTLLPYTLQSEYNRARRDLALDGAILENEYLRATFIPSLGADSGRFMTKRREESCFMPITSSNPATWPFATPGFPGAWNGTWASRVTIPSPQVPCLPGK